MKKGGLLRKSLLFLGVTLIFSAIVKHSQESAYDLNFLSNYSKYKALPDNTVKNTSAISYEIKRQPYEEQKSDTAVKHKCDSPQKEKFRFLINTKTNKYHNRQCSAAAKLTADKRLEVEFEAPSCEDAEGILQSRGYTICGLCKRM